MPKQWDLIIMSNSNFILPQRIEALISTLAKLYENKAEKKLQEILVNSKITVVDGIEHDNLDGGIDGHLVILTLPEILFFNIFDSLDEISKEICTDLNKINTSIRNEYVSEVSIEKIDVSSENWRQDSGLLQEELHTISSVVQEQLWDKGKYRIFISHKTEDKNEVAKLKLKLALYGISCFVAHEDISPTKRWADEIENALFSMDCCVAIMTPEFHESDWTDHELGCAYGRHVPVIAIRMGKDPYGLIGRFQALTASWDTLPQALVELLIQHNKMKDAFIGAIENCTSFDDANKLAKIFPKIDKMAPSQITKIISVVNNNTQVSGSYGFDGNKERFYGKGIIYYLRQWSSKKYERNADGKITEI